jgi:hypothetical protein
MCLTVCVIVCYGSDNYQLALKTFHVSSKAEVITEVDSESSDHILKYCCEVSCKISGSHSDE